MLNNKIRMLEKQQEAINQKILNCEELTDED
jgi:hypothetical protein